MLNGAPFRDRIRIPFEWTHVATATSYDVFVWPSSSARPEVPSHTNVFATTVNSNVMLEDGEDISWQVSVRFPGGGIDGEVWQFVTRPLPNLVIDKVTATPTLFTGEDLVIDWKVSQARAKPANSCGFTTARDSRITFCAPLQHSTGC